MWGLWFFCWWVFFVLLVCLGFISLILWEGAGFWICFVWMGAVCVCVFGGEFVCLFVFTFGKEVICSKQARFQVSLVFLECPPLGDKT